MLLCLVFQAYSSVVLFQTCTSYNIFGHNTLEDAGLSLNHFLNCDCIVQILKSFWTCCSKIYWMSALSSASSKSIFTKILNNNPNSVSSFPIIQTASWDRGRILYSIVLWDWQPKYRGTQLWEIATKDVQGTEDLFCKGILLTEALVP